MAEPIEVSFGTWTWAGQGNMGSKSPTQKGNFERGRKGVAHCKEQGLSVVSCAKTAELIEMQFGTLSVVGQGNHVLDGGALLGCPTV